VSDSLEVRTTQAYSFEIVDTDDLVEVATLEVVVLLARIEGPCEMKYCSARTRVWDQAQTGIEATLDGRHGEGSCDWVAGRIGDAVWEEDEVVEPGMAFHNRRTCWSYKVLVVYSRLLLTRTV